MKSTQKKKNYSLLFVFVCLGSWLYEIPTKKKKQKNLMWNTPIARSQMVPIGNSPVNHIVSGCEILFKKIGGDGDDTVFHSCSSFPDPV